MPQKHKKIKNKDAPKRRGNDFSRNEKFKQIEKSAKSATLSSQFKSEELQELKNILKIKDVNNVPLTIACTVLDKIDFLKKLIAEGCNVNELGPNRTTPLMWAVKLKNLDAVDILLANGADSAAKNDSGYNALFLALESKIWDEKSFVKLWQRTEQTAFVDIDLMGKYGRNALHTTVRREWAQVLRMLIAEKVNINATNSNKVTPLMLASFLNNHTMVNELLEAKADVLKEDCSGGTALSYAIATVVTKNLETPHLVVNRLLSTLETSGITFEKFLRNYVDAFLNGPFKQKRSGQTFSDTKDYIIPYALQYKCGSLNLLLDENIFNKTAQALDKYQDDPQHLTKYLSVVDKILHCQEFTSNSIKERTVTSFLSEGCADKCLDILKRYSFGNTINFDSSTVFEILLLISVCQGHGRLWLSDNYDDMFSLHAKYIGIHHKVEELNKNNEEFLKLIELIRMIKTEKTTINEIPLVCEDNSEVLQLIDSKNAVEEKPEIKLTTKRAKRRSKAVKAKIAKIKSADLTDQLNQADKKGIDQKCSSDTSIVVNLNQNKKLDDQKPQEKILQWPHYSSWEQVWLMDTGNDPVMKEYNNMMVVIEHKITEELRTTGLDDVKTLKSNGKSLFRSKSKSCSDCKTDTSLKDANAKFMDFLSGNDGQPEQDSNNSLQTAIKYLGMLLAKILEKYQTHWSREHSSWKPSLGTKKMQNNQADEIVKKLETEHIQRVQNEFDALIAKVSNSNKDMPLCIKVLERLENTLIGHKIRGKSIMDGVVLNTQLNDTSYGGDFQKTSQLVETKNSDFQYLEELSSFPTPKPTDLSQSISAQENTMKYAYHLLSSIHVLCEENDDATLDYDQDVQDLFPASRKRLSFYENFLAVQNRRNHGGDINMIVFSDSVNLREDNLGQFSSRWCNIVKSLQAGNDFQVLLNGDIRISSKDQDVHIISSGGNFSTVVLGLDANDQPLAVKRIKAQTEISKLMKDLINPLLGLRNTNLLPYFTCNFEKNELVVATPLCEYNMGEYVMFMKQHNHMLSRSFNVVKQFLSGLRFLHNRKDPIIHGNLKPSNIFLDCNGIVRIAEFGMHRALYTLTEAPNTSVIWFSRETFHAFKETSSVSCTCASDIQVAGMLVHFVLTAGKHPFGESMEDILRNIERAAPQLMTTNIELQDLMSWMLLYEPTERPTINQVLSHVFFWPPDRKWRFILACAGLNPYGTPYDIPVKELLLYISVVAARENIRGKWIAVTKRKFPQFKYSEQYEDNIAGLLTFIRYCIQHEMIYCVHGQQELRGFIIETFPAVPLSLYRILEASQWLTHYVLQPFTTVDSVSA